MSYQTSSCLYYGFDRSRMAAAAGDSPGCAGGMSLQSWWWSSMRTVTREISDGDHGEVPAHVRLRRRQEPEAGSQEP